jgi:hypothetical protein
MRPSTNYYIDHISAKGAHHIMAGPFNELAAAKKEFRSRAFALPHSTLQLRRGNAVYARWHRGNMAEYEKPRAFSVAW